MGRRFLTLLLTLAACDPADASPPWLPPLPFEPGAVRGTANTGAGGCVGCHADVGAEWAASAHATGATSPRFREDPGVIADPDCRGCHLPLAAQHPTRWTRDAAGELVEAPQHAWDPFLGHEGVTCATCHVRDGVVLAAAVSGRAPHPVAASAGLTGVEACAGCHQLTWAGAPSPWYDTVGEWERSPYRRAGVPCQGCHMGPGAGRTARGHDHTLSKIPGAGLSVLATLTGRPTPDATATLAITVQNTGAGHAVPTGSPRRGLTLTVDLTRADGGPGVRLLEHRFERRFDPRPPWPVTADDRLLPGGMRRFDLPIVLPAGAPAHGWTLDARLVPTWDGEPAGAPTWSRVVPIP